MALKDLYVSNIFPQIFPCHELKKKGVEILPNIWLKLTRYMGDLILFGEAGANKFRLSRIVLLFQYITRIL